MTLFIPEHLGSPFKPVTFYTLTDQVTEQLRQAIQTGGIPLGEPLVERELAAQLGLSRVPVREAIQRLSQARLLKRTANHGVMVYLPSLPEIQEISSLRILLEQLVAESVIEQWSSGVEATLYAIVRQMKSAAQTQDRLALSNLETEFHATLWEIAGYGVLTEVVSDLRGRVARLLFESLLLCDVAALSATSDSHAQLIDVFRKGDPVQARMEMHHHITMGKEQILVALPHIIAQAHPGQQ